MNLPGTKVYKLFLKILSRTNDYEDRQRLHRAFRTVYRLDTFEDYQAINRLIRSEVASRCRVRKYVKHLVDDYYPLSCVLLSLTFSDDVLSSTSSDSRKKYVRDYLNSTFVDYFACVDFGKKHGREHYHALAILPLGVEFDVCVHRHKSFYSFSDSSLLWDYGFMSMRPVSSALGSYHYAFKASGYAFKSESAKPFHKRGVVKFESLNFDDDLIFD